jgi:tetratricopeptide (TPR) repeat protein
MHVEPLEREAAESLLTLLADDDIGDDARADLLDRSGGNPFFLEELVALLGETGSTEGVRVPVHDEHDVAELTGLPDTLRGLVVARLDALDADERAVVEDAAVLGRTGPLEALELMGKVRRSAESVSTAVAGLVDKEVLLVEDAGWAFRSDLVRDVAYGTMTKARRAVSHAGIARWLEAHLGGPETPDSVIDRMAHHYGTAAELVADMGDVDGVPDDLRERALRWIGEAGARALESEHHLVGSRLFTQTLLIIGDEPSPARWEALLGRSRCRANLREVEGAREDAEAVLAEAEQAGNLTAEGRALTALGDAEQKAGDSSGARRTFTRAIELLTEAGADRERGEALRLRGMAELFEDEYEAAEGSISAALEVARAEGDRQGEAWALQNLAWLAFETGNAHEAEQWLDLSVDAFTEIGDSGGLGWALGLSAWVKMHVGEREEAGRLAARLLPETRARGDQWAEAMLRMLSASVHLWSGRAAEAIEPAVEAEALFGQAGDRSGVVQAQTIRGRALLLRGRIAEGWSLLEAGRPAAGGDDEGPDAYRTGLIGVTLGAAAIGDPMRVQRVVGHLDGLGIDIDAIGGVDLLAGLALVHLQLGDAERAGSLVGRFVGGDAPPAPSLAAVAALVEAARGRRDEATRLAESVSGATRSTFLDRSTASMALGLLAAREGDGAASAEHFAAARSDLEGTDDRLDVAVLALAEAEALKAMGAERAVAADEAADGLWRELGERPSGWRTAIALTLAAARDGGA